VFPRPTNIRITQFQGSEAEGTRSGWPSDGGGPAGASWATRVARAPRVPSTPEPFSAGPDSSSETSLNELTSRPQGTGLEPSQSPWEGRGENGGWGEGFQDSKVSLPQDTGTHGSTKALEAHACSKNSQDEVLGAKEAYYAQYVAPPHTKRTGVETTVVVAPVVEDAMVVAEDADLVFQTYFYRPPEPGLESELEPTPDRRPTEGVQLEFPCPTWSVLGECEGEDGRHDRHFFAKEIICNREWCRSCGGVDGRAHQRRKAAWLPRACQMRVVGCFVLTIPPELRDRYRTRVALGKLGTAAKRMLQRHGFGRGLRRWHIFGEDHPGEGLQGDGLPPYHPHLNVLVEAGFLEPEVLEAVKDSWARILHVDRGRINLHYQFATTVPDKLHLVKYVLRPTFTDWSWDEELAWELLGFHNSQAWGGWHDPPAWDVPVGDEFGTPALVALEQGLCPVDNTPITWRGVVRTTLQVAPWWEELGGGYRMWTGLARDGPEK